MPPNNFFQENKRKILKDFDEIEKKVKKMTAQKSKKPTKPPDGEPQPANKNKNTKSCVPNGTQGVATSYFLPILNS